tara:strand:+ start:14334 stop:14936 length:603 start_codon:yes stop_codon:yes gene_type:complete
MPTIQPPPRTQTSSNVLDALFHEYEAVYRLAEFRLAALDRRIPLIGGVLTAFLSAVPVLPGPSQILGLIAIPISLIWLVRTTINHARSFEDALRAIEKLEMRINKQVGEKVMGFQSTHPSRGETIGGRTGHETVMAVVVASCLLLGISLWMAASIMEREPDLQLLYTTGIASIVVLLMYSVRSWGRYRYRARNGLKPENQ